MLADPDIGGERIEILPMEDDTCTTTGNFEVTIIKVDKDGHRQELLIHSKRHMGMGKALSRKERMAIVEKIADLGLVQEDGDYM